MYSITNKTVVKLIFGARTEGPSVKKLFGPPSTDTKTLISESIHECHVDKNGGKISDF